MSYQIGGDFDRVGLAQLFSLGTIHQGHDGKLYKYVKYNDGAANLDLVAGDVVQYVTDSGYKVHTVTADDASGGGIGAGVVQATVTDDQSFMWIQLTGGATLSEAIGGAAADGDALTAVGAADKALTLVTAADHPVVAYSPDVSAKEIICVFPI